MSNVIDIGAVFGRYKVLFVILIVAAFILVIYFKSDKTK